MLLGDHVDGGLVELSLKPVYWRLFRTGPRAARSFTYMYFTDAVIE